MFTLFSGTSCDQNLPFLMWEIIFTPPEATFSLQSTAEAGQAAHLNHRYPHTKGEGEKKPHTQTNFCILKKVDGLAFTNLLKFELQLQLL